MRKEASGWSGLAGEQSLTGAVIAAQDDVPGVARVARGILAREPPARVAVTSQRCARPRRTTSSANPGSYSTLLPWMGRCPALPIFAGHGLEDTQEVRGALSRPPGVGHCQLPVHLDVPESGIAPEAQQAAHAPTATPGLSAGRYWTAGVVVVDADLLPFLERLATHRAGVPLVLQHLVELLLGPP
jgi:hypothetical protein